MALMAKQGWRIYKNENSLLHQVLKVRYFLNSSFSESHLGSNPSFTWQKIWEAKRWVEEGCIWCMGDGKLVRVWVDCWIPGHLLTLTALAHYYPFLQHAIVDKLFEEHSKHQCIPTLQLWFHPSVVVSILKITLSQSPHLDRLIWKEEIKCEFGVKVHIG